MNLNITISAFIPPYFHWWHLPIVFLAGLIGEGYGTLIGSGGILIQFVLASLGMPLPSVVATDIAGAQAANIGVISASPKKVWKNKHLLIFLTIPIFLGGIVGTVFLTHTPVLLLRYVLIGGLSFLLLYMFTGKQNTLNAPEMLRIKLQHYPFLFLVMFSLGIYGNISGVGLGTFQKLAFVSLLQFSFIDSLGINSIISLPAGIFSFITTAIIGLIAYPYVLTLWLGTFLGSRHVTKHMRKIPNNYLKVLLIVISFIYLVYLLIK